MSIDLKIFIKEMQRLIIKQYYGKPNAMAEIDLYCNMIKTTFKVFNQLTASTGYPVSLLAQLSGLKKPPNIKDNEYLMLLKAFFLSKHADVSLNGLQKIYSNAFNNNVLLQEKLIPNVSGTDNSGNFHVIFERGLSKEFVDFFKNNTHFLPSPIGVNPIVEQGTFRSLFGFSDNQLSIGFGSKIAGSQAGGAFASKF